MNTYRSRLSSIYRHLKEQPQIRSENATHAGLWFDKYIEDQSREDTTQRGSLISVVATLPPPDAYLAFYERWEKTLSDYGAKTRIAQAQGRMIVGLGHESVLETSITLHRTYGVPYIPGSALKGLAASYARQRLGEAWNIKSEAYRAVFGDTDNAGFITFFDAYYIPGSAKRGQGREQREQAIYPDVITVHHPSYYQNQNDAPADWDSPNPVPFPSATGSYLIGLAAPELEQGEEWIQRTFSILEQALATMGIGAKTSSGYGRMKLEVPPPPPAPPVDPELKQAEGYKIEIDALKDVAGQINGYYQKWKQLTSPAARLIVANAIVDKVRQAGREKNSAEKAWYKELLAFISATEEVSLILTSHTMWK